MRGHCCRLRPTYISRISTPLGPRPAVPLPRSKGTKVRRAAPLTPDGLKSARLKHYPSDTVKHREEQGGLFAEVSPSRTPCCVCRKILLLRSHLVFGKVLRSTEVNTRLATIRIFTDSHPTAL